MKSSYMLMILVISTLGCLRTFNSSPPTIIDYAKIEVPSTTTTSTSTSTTTTLVDYAKLYAELVNKTSESTTTSTTTTTTTTTTSTTSTTIKKPYAPVKIKMNPNWQVCNKTRDCIIVNDCCGTGPFGFKYTISSHYQGDWEWFLSRWCDSKDHRSGCGFETPHFTQTLCQNNTCTLSYGSFVEDGLPENPAYNWDFIYIENRTYNNTRENSTWVNVTNGTQ